jgi:parvulin-like peptidyl-prolyl isomerase
MNARHLIALALLLPLYAGAAAPAKPSTQEGAAKEAPAAARVNGIVVPMARLDAALRIAVAQGNADTPELRANLRSQLVAREVFRQEAAKRGWQNDPQVLEARDTAMIQRYLKDAVRPAPVREEAVRARYDEIVGGLGEKEFHVRVLAVADEAKARELLSLLKAGKADFAALAKENSVLPSRAAGGEMDWVSFKTPVREGQTQNLPLPIAQSMAALPAGAVSAEPIAWGGRWYLVRMEEVRPTRIPAYDDVKAGLRQALEAQALEKATAELVARLVGAARIQ